MTPPPEPRTQDDSWIVDVDVRTFERDIIERSMTVPVVVDFWATWCGPCKTLGPELERRAREGAGRFVLAKVDIDRSPELAQAFRVQAVPTVLVVAGGRMVDGFQGALPPEELDRFLDQVAPGKAPPPGTRLIEAARELAADGRADEAIGHLREFLRDHHDHDEARLVLAEILLDVSKPIDARKVLDRVQAGPATEDRLRALRARLDLLESAGDRAELEARVAADPDDLGARIDLARALIAGGDHAAGLEHLLEVVRRDEGERRKQAKAAMLEAFDILGLEDPVANDYRFKLSLELFS